MKSHLFLQYFRHRCSPQVYTKQDVACGFITPKFLTYSDATMNVSLKLYLCSTDGTSQRCTRSSYSYLSYAHKRVEDTVRAQPLCKSREANGV